jgi:regulator of protease activity HflC (stomatin/prohibitin superfamily)
MYGLIGVLIVVALALATSAVKVLNEYERGVVLTIGRYTGTKGPGLILLVPFVQRILRVDLRTVVMEVPPQDVISRDNVSVKVSAVIYFRVVEPSRAMLQVVHFYDATSQLAQTTLRSVLGEHELDDLLSAREVLNRDLQSILEKQTDAWGIKVSNVEIKQVDLDESMVRAIARQAEAERTRRAQIIHADGELQAAEKLKDAAAKLSQQPQALQLRYLQTLIDIAGEKNSTIVFPLPLDLITPLIQKLSKG